MPKTLEQKREEATARLSDHAQRTIEEQLALIDARPGNSARERARLLKIHEDAAADVAKKEAKRGEKKAKKVAR